MVNLNKVKNQALDQIDLDEAMENLVWEITAYKIPFQPEKVYFWNTDEIDEVAQHAMDDAELEIAIHGLVGPEPDTLQQESSPSQELTQELLA